MNDKMGNTWISEWNLVCDSSYLKTFAETVFLLGVASGGVISGYLSDRFGRKRLLFLSVVLQTIFGKFRNYCTPNTMALLPHIIWIVFFRSMWCESITHHQSIVKQSPERYARCYRLCTRFYIESHSIRFRSLRADIISRTFGAARPTRRLFCIGHICRTHFGHWICWWTMAYNCRHVQSIPIARIVHDNRRHRISHTRFSQSTTVHWDSGRFSLFPMVNIATWSLQKS